MSWFNVFVETCHSWLVDIMVPELQLVVGAEV